MKLTPRHTEVGALLAQGLSNKAIGAQLGISLATVKSHLTIMYARMKVKNRTQAAVKLVDR